MIVLYTLMLGILGILKRLTDARASRLEQRYVRTASEADHLLRESPGQRPNGRLDAAQAAKRQYLLGQLVQKRERLESKYVVWKGRADRLGIGLARLRGWQGRKLPYTFGIVDMTMLLSAVDALGAGHYVNVHTAWQVVSKWLTR